MHLELELSRPARMLDTIVRSVSLVWLLSLTFDTLKLILEFGLICPFVAIDPTDYGATTVVAPGRMIENFLPIPDAESIPHGIKASLCVCGTI
jgi:hypothetical protein